MDLGRGRVKLKKTHVQSLKIKAGSSLAHSPTSGSNIQLSPCIGCDRSSSGLDVMSETFIKNSRINQRKRI